MTLPQVVQANLAPFLRPAEVPELGLREESLFLELFADDEARSRKALQVTIPSQKMDNWCWAAVAVGISDAYHDPPISQCTVASKVQKIRCCSKPPDRACTQEQPLSPGLSLEGHEHFVEYLDPDRTAPLLVPHKGWAFLTDHIDRGLPVPVRIAFGTGHGYGHFVVVTGYQMEPSGLYLIVSDPENERWHFELTEFIAHFHGTGRWHTTYELKPAGVIPEMK